MKPRPSNSATWSSGSCASPHYAEELLDDMSQLEGGWPERVLDDAAQLDRAQRGHRGRLHARRNRRKIRVFTTRVDTIYGATCVILAPEHPLVEELCQGDVAATLKAMVDDQRRKDPENLVKEGFFTGHYRRQSLQRRARSRSGSATSC